MPAARRGLDASDLQLAADLLDLVLDPRRTICLPLINDPVIDDRDCVAALAGLANSHGGYLILGARADDSGTVVRELTGVRADWAEDNLTRLAEAVDPPLTSLVRARSLAGANGAAAALVSVRQSARPPHLDTITGQIFVHGVHGTEPLRLRAELDRLFQKGRARDERADRLLDATIERLTLAHFGHYGLAVVACLREASSEPYLWSRDRPQELADSSDPFVDQWKFSAEMARVRPGEVELRNEREITGIIRVGRAGYVVVGTVLRRPTGDVLGSAAELTRTLSRLIATACRVLEQADAPTIVPRLVCEGLKGSRLFTGGGPGTESAPSSVDSVHARGTSGDPGDGSYRGALAHDFAQRLLAAYALDGVVDAAT